MEPWKGQANALVGQGGEAAAKKFLRAQGYEIVDSRWSCSAGEIDLIARRNRLFIFVEVKTSRSIDQAVIRLSQGQQRRIVNAAQIWLSKHAFGPQYLFRFDAIFVGDGGQLKHIEGAWTA
ncbi:MAG: YraN family protein [Pseudomonadota bacterium]|nr:YraN family protein [Pseudomonadota bacterium]MEC8710338.1 YraN family protein [Pseudomonadota bacterium]